MKRHIISNSQLSPISIVAIVDDINVPTPVVFAPVVATVGDDFDKEDLLDCYFSEDIPTLRQIRKFTVLNQMVELKEDNPDFKYKFTKEQKDILEQEYAHYQELTDDELTISKLLTFIRTCNRCTIPVTRKSPDDYKNFADYHDLDLSPKDYLALVRKLDRSNFKGFIRSKYRTYLGDKIYQFCREDDYVDAKGNLLGHFNLWIEINLRLSYEGDVIALISLHDAEFKASPS